MKLWHVKKLYLEISRRGFRPLSSILWRFGLKQWTCQCVFSFLHHLDVVKAGNKPGSTPWFQWDDYGCSHLDQVTITFVAFGLLEKELLDMCRYGYVPAFNCFSSLKSLQTWQVYCNIFFFLMVVWKKPAVSGNILIIECIPTIGIHRWCSSNICI